MSEPQPFVGNPVSWSICGDTERWDIDHEYLELSVDGRLWEWDGDEWVIVGDGKVGSIARWVDDGGAWL